MSAGKEVEAIIVLLCRAFAIMLPNCNLPGFFFTILGQFGAFRWTRTCSSSQLIGCAVELIICYKVA
jgi:hypothetical protein